MVKRGSDPIRGHATRRDFLRRAAGATSCLLMQGLGVVGGAGQTRERRTNMPVPVSGAAASGGPGIIPGAPVTVITQPVSTDANPRTRAWGYLTEVLSRAGLFYETLPASQLESLFRRAKSVVILAGDLPLTQPQREALAQWVKEGGALIGLGGASGLEEVFGVAGGIPVAEGWIKVTAGEHPLTAGLRSSLHVFGGRALKKSSATVLAELQTGNGISKGSAILENRFGTGRTVLLGPDLLFSIVHIQQGLRVLQDGRPAPDDSAPVNEGLLKTEDGLVLDWQRDRSPVPPDDGPLFLEPISDELRELILRSVFHLARQQAILLPVLWYWPRSLKAVAQLSHDSDGNDPQKAAALLEVMNRSRLKSTWCILYPGGYPAEFYRTLVEQDFEVALHYDAMTGGEHTAWSRDNFLFQQRWLMKEAGLEQITTNKNHYLRWEGRLDFLRWCESAGIASDQSRGPSKKGTIGFPLGGSQPYFPLDDEADSPRFLNVLEVNLLTQDLVITCPPEYGQPLLDSAARHHGVAHFLFHPAHILKPGVADALAGLVDYGRKQGLEWWTNRQIWQWEMARRGVEARFHSGNAFTLRATASLPQATLLLLRSQPASRALALNGRPTDPKLWDLYGFEFDALTVDIGGEIRVQTI